MENDIGGDREVAILLGNGDGAFQVGTNHSLSTTRSRLSRVTSTGMASWTWWSPSPGACDAVS